MCILDNTMYILDNKVFILDNKVFILDNTVFILDNKVSILDNKVYILDNIIYILVRQNIQGNSKLSNCKKCETVQLQNSKTLKPSIHKPISENKIWKSQRSKIFHPGPFLFNYWICLLGS